MPIYFQKTPFRLLPTALCILALLSTALLHAEEGGKKKKEKEAAKEKITVKVSTPDTAWRITIDEVHKVGEEIWVISTLSRLSSDGGCVISTVTASVDIDPENAPIKHYVLGKTWKWKNSESHTFIKNRTEIPKALKKGTLLYKKPKAKTKK